MKAAQSAGRSAGGLLPAQPRGAAVRSAWGRGRGWSPGMACPAPQNAPPPGATARLPAAWLSQRVTCYAKACQSDLRIPVGAHLLGARASPHPEDRQPAWL